MIAHRGTRADSLGNVIQDFIKTDLEMFVLGIISPAQYYAALFSDFGTANIINGIDLQPYVEGLIKDFPIGSLHVGLIIPAGNLWKNDLSPIQDTIINNPHIVKTINKRGSIGFSSVFLSCSCFTLVWPIV